MQVEADPIDRLVGLSLDALERRELLAPPVLTLLVRCYASGREEIGSPLADALAASLEIVSADRPARRDALDPAPDWVWLFLEATAVSDDDRLASATARLVTDLCGEWPLDGSVEQAMRSLDACLCAFQAIGRPDLLALIVDELERVVGLTYRPGMGVRRAIAPSETDAGDLPDHAAAASALLTAYSFTERLPYSMLAEELMQVARRRWWDESRGGFAVSRPDPLESFLQNCTAARVLCRLAALHADQGYRQSAVVAAEGDYVGDAARILGGLAAASEDFGLEAATYALALIEFNALT